MNDERRPEERRPVATTPMTTEHEYSAADHLRRLARMVTAGDAPPADRLIVASGEAARLVADGAVNRTAATTVVSVAAQAVGIGQADAFATLREVFGGAR